MYSQEMGASAIGTEFKSRVHIVVFRIYKQKQFFKLKVCSHKHDLVLLASSF